MPNRNNADNSFSLSGHAVLAGTATFQRRHFAEEWTVEQYYGADLGDADEGLDKQLAYLPKVVIGDALIPLYDGVASRAVARPQYAYSGQAHRLRLMLCPYLTARLGWRPKADDVFTVLDENGDPVVRSIFWRDGGLRARTPDTGRYGEGCLLIVREDRMHAITSECAEPAIARAWRAFGHHERPFRETNVSAPSSATNEAAPNYARYEKAAVSSNCSPVHKRKTSRTAVSHNPICLHGGHDRDA